MARRMLLIAVAVLTLGTLSAQERISLTTPETAPSNTKYRVSAVTLTPDDPDIIADTGVFSIQLMSDGRRDVVTCTYGPTTTPTGTFLINGLNKANLSTAYGGNATTGSLVQRITHRLVIMNEAPAVCGRSLAGTLTGGPQ